jgi:uncharacterized oxidoreductase
MNLRYPLSKILCKVAELIPPAVKTSLAGSVVNDGVPLDEFCESVFHNLFYLNNKEVVFDPLQE